MDRGARTRSRADVDAGLVGTIVYALLGLPHPIVLTFLAAFVPLRGTSTVWVPAAIGLALAGRAHASGVLVVFGVLLIGTVDNMMREWIGHCDGSRGPLRRRRRRAR